MKILCIGYPVKIFNRSTARPEPPSVLDIARFKELKEESLVIASRPAHSMLGTPALMYLALVVATLHSRLDHLRIRPSKH